MLLNESRATIPIRRSCVRRPSASHRDARPPLDDKKDAAAVAIAHEPIWHSARL
jgi:hypothetical protein